MNNPTCIYLFNHLRADTTLNVHTKSGKINVIFNIFLKFISRRLKKEEKTLILAFLSPITCEIRFEHNDCCLTTDLGSIID